jgi:hypothetical protein
MEKILKATHTGILELDLGRFKIPCAVLEDSTRLLTQGGFLTTIGRSRTPKAGTGVTVAEVPTFLAANNLKPFIDSELLESTKPIKFLSKGRVALGYKAELLPKVCEVYLKAKDADKLLEAQEKIADRCGLIVRALAHVGIIALVDEATGYQEIRDRRALQKILDKYLLAEYAKWAKRFPDEFYELMFRLKGWQWKGMKINRPSVVGHYTNDLVYQRLAPGLLTELKRLNPPDEEGRRRSKHQQWLTEDVGHPALQRHLNMLIGFERASANWGMFYRMVQRALPKLNEQIPLALEE